VAPRRDSIRFAGTLRNWEVDRGFPPLAALVKLANALGVTVERLAEGVDDPTADDPGSNRSRPTRTRLQFRPSNFPRDDNPPTQF
jgi:hypothetical protein